MIAKRTFDLFFSLTGTIILSPLFVLVAFWIKLDSPGPVFFRQVRVGRYGKPFRIFKFRTMSVGAEREGAQLTVGKDRRISRAGRFLRHHKLDELPQLLNVLKGEMSLVGPRPEVPRYVGFYPESIREMVLSVRPGITDYASIEFKDENEILGRAANPESAYIDEVMPIKLEYYVRYVAEASVSVDFKLIMATLKVLIPKRVRSDNRRSTTHITHLDGAQHHT